MEELLERLLEECRSYTRLGKLADYIPELSKADINDFGVYLVNSDGKEFYAGDFDKKFTIQSIIKPLLLLMALMDNTTEYVRQYIGVEATGKPFNAIDYSEQLILKEHINPMVNIGAIEMCSMIHGETYEERSGIIDDDVEEILDIYFRACSIRVTCKDLANIGFVLANHGRGKKTGEVLFSGRHARFVNAILTTCGMYDGSGDFAIKVGLPAKSGVGGGIMAVSPTRMGIGIYSPGLDKKGNSLAGIQMLEQLSETLYLSMF